MVKTMLLDTAKTLAGSKTVHQILKYLGTFALNYAADKFMVNLTKNDASDMKTMVYNHNMNNNDIISPIIADDCYSIKKIENFIKEFNRVNNIPDDNNEIVLLLKKLGSVLNNKKEVDKIINEYLFNQSIKKFNSDNDKTTSIATEYEIDSGGIYLPKKELVLDTPEGKIIANNKNKYLEERLSLGENASERDVDSLIKKYHELNKTEEVNKYFNEHGVKL